MKTGLLFYGFRHAHVNTLYKMAEQSPLVDIVDCVEENEAARTQAASALGARFSGRSYESALSDPGVDAVVIGNAYGHRGDAVIQALQTGKHVLADKPICTELSQLDTIRELARETGLTLWCMLDLRYLPQTVTAEAVLRSGRLGPVRNVAFNGQHCLDYEKRPGWYFEPGMHGGTVNDLAIHGIDLVRMLTGQEFAGVDGVRTWNAYATRHPHFKDSALFLARLENGAGVMADVSYSAPKTPAPLPSYWEFRIWCEKGMLTFNYRDSSVAVYEAGNSEILPGTAPDRDFLQDFLGEMETGGRDLTESLLRSTETALWLQAEADRRAEHG